MTKNVDDIYVLKSRVSDSNLQRDNYSDLPTPGKKYAIYDLQIFVVIYFLININALHYRLRDYNFNKMREFKEGYLISFII